MFAMIQLTFYISSFILLVLCRDVRSREDTVGDIQFLYYNGKTPKEFTKYPLTQFMKIPNEKMFKKRNGTVLYIHGYEETASSHSINTVVRAFMNLKPATNIILLDWANMAGHTFTNAARNTDKVGRAAGNYILTAVGKTIDKNNFYIVAHSLGCHVASGIAKTTKIYGITLKRITGLDCAFPGYYPSIVGMRLDAESAEFVDNIHTDSARYGIPFAHGHVDFWPNGGFRQQPGCSDIDIFRAVGANTMKNELCSHHRSWMFYAESLQHPKNFLAVKCDSYEMFQKNRCNNVKTAYMGYSAAKTLRGNYYLATNDKSPFGKGKNGIQGPK